jgi:antitoxin component YwqK of YwqJK toxin-antitoxin module
LKKNILLLLIYIIFSSCKEKTIIENELDLLAIIKESYNTIDTTFYENKKIKSLRFYKEKTEYVDINFYESGKKKSFGKVKDNQCHEEYIDWYENGKQKWIRKYNIGEQIGKNISFYENGNLEKEFDNDTKEMTDYWLNGKAKYKMIEKVSQSYHYYNGNFMEKYIHKGNNELSYEYFNENGKLVFSGNSNNQGVFKDNLKYNGEIICYFDNGKASIYQNIINGHIVGKYYNSYGNGNLKCEGFIENGKEVYFKCYHENGKVDFIRDRKNNTFTQWDEKGNLIE